MSPMLLVVFIGAGICGVAAIMAAKNKGSS